MSPSAPHADLLSSVAQHVYAGNRLMASLELEPQMPVIGDQASSWLWQAWLADSPDAARTALQKAQTLDRDNEMIAAGLTFVQGLLDWQPGNVDTDFDLDPEFWVGPAGQLPVARLRVEADFDVDSELLVDPVEVASFVPSVAPSEVACTERGKIVELESEDAESPQVSRDVSDSAKLLILVVDDSRTVRELVTFTLSTAGYEVVTAADGAEAIEMITDCRPALVLCDVNMPKLDGYKLCSLIKNHEDTDDIPVVLLLENDGVIDKVRRSVSGCQDWIVKPFKSEDLIDKVRDHVLVSGESEQCVDA